MTWKELEKRIQREIRPRKSAILKADGKERRIVTSNKGGKIGMRTGKETNNTKAVTYEMIRFAFDTVSREGRFDSDDFRNGFRDKYNAAPCRFSMTGGVLVELGIADLIPSEDETTCYYTLKK
ncbi:MAG TPA: hypothetical protein VJL59_08620 [Anaerolineales bacterium]|nr:hypothetical protein [Anaerolineales bacterium]